MTPPLGLLDALAGRRLLVTGATGFIGKVALALLLDRQEGVGRISVVVRPSSDADASERLFSALRESPVFGPLRAKHGARFENFLRERLQALPGDVTRPDFGLGAEDLEALTGTDVLLHIAGLVSMNVALDESLRANAWSARHGARLAVRLGCRLVHVSTAYVAGARSGAVGEDEPLLGAYPRRAELGVPFSAETEVADCERVCGEVRSAARDRRQRREADRLLAEEGLRRARRWGWPNVYCYTKALGEQLVAATPGVQATLVRPTIVESSHAFPFSGWNEGMNTSAPIIHAMLRGHTLWPIRGHIALDVAPVDHVCAALLAVTGAAALGEHRPVYHLGSSDSNPFALRQCVSLIGRYRRRHFRDFASGSRWAHWLRTRPAILTVPHRLYESFSAPARREAARRLAALLERAGRRAPRGLVRVERDMGQVDHVVRTFLPFIHDNDYVFRCDNIRALYARSSESDRQALPWAPESVDWDHYWPEIHIEGLRRWVFPSFGGSKAAAERPLGRALVMRGLAKAQKSLYGRVFQTQVRGAENVPSTRQFIVAANHASHLDMGLIKHALGASGKDLVALAAKDYFFRSPLRRFFFSNFTNLVPIDRRMGLKDSLQKASEVLQRGRNLLIFPEGTRSRSGRIAPFKPSLGYLALKNGVDILPVCVEGTYEALPKGAVLPRARRIAATIGPVIPVVELRRLTEGLPKREAYRVATERVEAAIRGLAEGLPARAPSRPLAAPVPELG